MRRLAARSFTHLCRTFAKAWLQKKKIGTRLRSIWRALSYYSMPAALILNNAIPTRWYQRKLLLVYSIVIEAEPSSCTNLLHSIRKLLGESSLSYYLFSVLKIHSIPLKDRAPLGSGFSKSDQRLKRIRPILKGLLTLTNRMFSS